MLITLFILMFAYIGETLKKWIILLERISFYQLSNGYYNLVAPLFEAEPSKCSHTAGFQGGFCRLMF